MTDSIPATQPNVTNPDIVAWLVTGDDIDDTVYVDLQEAIDARDRDRSDEDADDSKWHREAIPLVVAKPTAQEPPVASAPLYVRVMRVLEKTISAALDDMDRDREDVMPYGMVGPLSCYVVLKAQEREEARQIEKESRDADLLVDLLKRYAPPAAAAKKTPAAKKPAKSKKASRVSHLPRRNR